MSRAYIVARRIALIAAVFSVVVCLLLVANYVSLRAHDPVPPAKLQDLQLALNRDPTNERLKAQVRSGDVALRRSYLRGRAFALRGSYLLLAGLAAFLVATEVLRRCRPTLPEPKPDAPARALASLAVGRRSVAVLSVGLGGLLVAMAVMARHDAAAEYAKAARRPPPGQAGQASVAQPASQPADAGDTGLPQLSGPINGLDQPSGSTLTAEGGTSLAPLPVGDATTRITTHPLAGTGPAIVAVSLLAPEEEWPRFRGPGGNGVASSKNPPTRWDGASGKGVAWKSPVPLPGWNSPIVWGDRVFLSGADAKRREVYCYDASTGKRLWTGEVPPASGEVKVSNDTGYAPSTLATNGRQVFAAFPSGDIACFSLDGNRLWVRSLGIPANQYGHGSSLLTYGNGVIVQLDQGQDAGAGKSELLALNVANGQTVWQVKRQVPNSWSTPILVEAAGRQELVTCASPWVIAYDPRTGTELWRAQCLSGDVAPSATFGGGFLFVANGGSVLAAIRAGGTGDVTKSAIAWVAYDGLPDIASPLATRDLVFLIAPDGTVTCVDAKTGKKLWEHTFDTPCRASPTLAGGNVYVLDTKGVMHIFKAASRFKLVGAASLGEDASASPAILRGRIYLRGERNLYCVGSK